MARKVLRLSQFQRLRRDTAKIAKEDAEREAATIPRNKVLNIPELFEMILANLDIKTLLLSQRVNPHWKATIEQSTTLQENLFLRVKPGHDQGAINNLLVHRRIRIEDFILPPDLSWYPLADHQSTWLYSSDLSTLSKHASARRMLLSSDRRVKCRTPADGMCHIQGCYAGREDSGWVFKTSFWCRCVVCKEGNPVWQA